MFCKFLTNFQDAIENPHKYVLKWNEIGFRGKQRTQVYFDERLRVMLAKNLTPMLREQYVLMERLYPPISGKVKHHPFAVYSIYH